MQTPTRLNLYISQSGLCSRRKADTLILNGEITVNHWPMKDVGYMVQEKDTVRYGKAIIKPEKLTYVLLNKPTSVITAVEDQFNRPTVVNLVKGKDITGRIYPVGRLDYDTSGVLILTNDGDLAQVLAHPKSEVQKVYRVTLKEDLAFDDAAKLKKGVFLTDGGARVDTLHQGYKKNVAQVTIHSGRNRIIRRMFESLGYTVKKLERVIFAGLTARDVKLGDWRFLTPAEVKKLQMLEIPGKKKDSGAKKKITGTKKTGLGSKKVTSLETTLKEFVPVSKRTSAPSKRLARKPAGKGRGSKKRAPSRTAKRSPKRK